MWKMVLIEVGVVLLPMLLWAAIPAAPDEQTLPK